MKTNGIMKTENRIKRGRVVIGYGAKSYASCVGISDIPYILESNPHPFYSFRGLKNQMRIRIERRLDSRSRAGFWKKG
jgi:hypothetical protein